MLRYSYLAAAIVLVLVAVSIGVRTQVMGATSDSDYVAKVSTGAPPAVVKGATIVQTNQDGTMQVLQKGTNGFTCMMVDQGTPGCADQNAMAWITALMSHAPPPTSTGFMYMLGGDQGASNSDPYATAQTAGNHWVKTGPHVMIFGPTVKTMGYPMTIDPDPTKPYVMWPNSPYAHLMIPVVVQH